MSDKTDVKELVVRRIDDDSEVLRVPVVNASRVDRVIGGMYINMDTENFYVDDSAFRVERA